MGEIKNKKSILIFLFFFSFSSFAQEKLSLKDCIDRAIEKNISIKNSSLDLLNSTENKKTAIGNFVPSFNINGNHSWNTGLTQNITTGILENQTTENSSMNISVAVDVFNGLANIRRLHRANLDLLAKDGGNGCPSGSDRPEPQDATTRRTARAHNGAATPVLSPVCGMHQRAAGWPPLHRGQHRKKCPTVWHWK